MGKVREPAEAKPVMSLLFGDTEKKLSFYGKFYLNLSIELFFEQEETDLGQIIFALSLGVN